MSPDLSKQLVEAATAGDVRRIEDLIARGADVNKRFGRVTPLIAAAEAGKENAVNVLLNNKANPEVRDTESCTVIKLALDKGHRAIAEALVIRFPKLTITDPRLPKGETWLREQFKLIYDNVADPASKPSPELLEHVIQGYKAQNLGPTDNRDISTVYWEHILLRYIGDVPLDIQRNYSENLVLSLIGTFEEILKGHEGIKKSAELLNSKLPTTQYDIVGTVVVRAGYWVTERWGYYDPENNLQVIDGIDSFLIEGAKITKKMINYTVENQVDSREEYEKKIGLKP